MKASSNNLEEIGSRMKSVRAHLGYSQDNLATLLGGSKRGIQNNESGKCVPGGEVIEGLIKLGISSHWLLTGEGAMLLSDAQASPAPYIPAEEVREMPHNLVPAGFAAIPLYDVRASAGGGAIVDKEEIIDVLHFKQEWIRQELRASQADLYLIYVDGESMEPTLRPGDIILVDHRDQQCSRDAIYVLRMNGALLVKRLQRKPGGLIKVSSDNPAYESFEVSLGKMADDFAIIGRLVWSGRRM